MSRGSIEGGRRGGFRDGSGERVNRVEMGPDRGTVPGTPKNDLIGDIVADFFNCL